MASVRVAVRVRPMNRREKDLTAKNIIKMDGTKTSITNLKVPEGVSGGDSMRDRIKTFTYDFSYDSADAKSSSYISQEKVFVDLGCDVLRSAFEGYNACILAYGQTGSGKSYTMMGNPGDLGLIPRICEGLFSRIATATRWDEASFRTEVSYLEIYNERVRDLLRRKSTQTYNLRVREHPKDGPYVEDLSKHLVQNYSDVEDLMEAGNINRTTASTGMNDVSSRSHAIFTINFTQAKFDSDCPIETVSRLHLVDLAGSERADATGASGLRLKEGGNINKSLVTLGNVISCLADLSQPVGSVSNQKKKSVFVPYRDSVLTWLLKDSLGGNAKTIMIATVSPADVNYGETLSTLRYANRAKNIVNKPTINEDANVRLIRELRAEIARLKALLVGGNQVSLLDSPTALSMEEKLHQNEARVLELTKEWTNKWNETQNILKEETLALRKEGIGVILDSELPHLIGIDDDLLSTGIILYHLKEGRTYVGREDASTEQDIILHGLDLDSEHCVFDNQNGTVTLVPLTQAQCSVNGVTVTQPTQLNQGAVILLGRTNMFRFNHPKEAAKLREKRKSGLLSTFSLSMSDLSKSCENLSTVMLYNPGLEFERQQREELDKLEHKRRQVVQMELRQQSEKEELQRLQRQVEEQRRQSEEVQRCMARQEESLRRRSQDIEARLRHLMAQKESFNQEVQERHLVAQKESFNQEVQERHLVAQKENYHQEVQEQEVPHLLDQKERCEEEAQQEEVHKEHEVHEEEQQEICRELERLRREYQEQTERLEAERSRLDQQEKEQEEALKQVAQRLEREVAAQRATLRDPAEEEEEEESLGPPESLVLDEEQRLTQEERQLCAQSDQTLPSLHHERQRTLEQLECHRRADVPMSLDTTLYQVEKELEDTEERLRLHSASTRQLQELQETYQFTANVARQEEKVRTKEKEILEATGRQQRADMEQAVSRLEKRHSALRQTAPSMDQDRVERELRQLRHQLSEVEGHGRSNHDDQDRINAYIEEEVQRRLRRLNLLNGGNMELSLSSDSIREEEEVSDCSSVRLTDEDDDKPQSQVNSRKLKYEQRGVACVPMMSSDSAHQEAVRVSIPRYVLRGQGKDQHFEFEVKISVVDETWTVFRRYSRFREMHRSLKSKYPQLAALEFPPKKLFGNRDERMVAERRSHLERYLKSFFQVMLSSGASPLRTVLGLNKHSICEFSPFFKKGVFDSSSHGTG